MESPEIAFAARNFAVMVRISGPDPKGLKFRRSAFHLHESGKTTLSASGMLVPDSLIGLPVGDFVAGLGYKGPEISGLVVTAGSLVEPFLPWDVRSGGVESGKLVGLINGAQIDVLSEFGAKEVGDGKHGRPNWMPVELVALFNIPDASDAVRSLIEVHLGLKEHSLWEAGWNLDVNNNSDVPNMNSTREVRSEAGSLVSSEPQDDTSNPGFLAVSATRIALLGISSVNSKDLPCIFSSSPAKRGELLLVMGSPFGILSPFHFLNSVSVGAVANSCPPGSFESSILMADVRCLPGMEGGPVFGKHSDFVGILMRPLRLRVGGAEVQIVVTWLAISITLRLESAKDHRSLRNRVSDIHSFNFENALRTIVLVSVSEGSWASGVILNEKGLVLTNAHVLEPWRFGRNLSVTDDTSSANVSIFSGLASNYQEASYERRNFTGGIFSKAYRGIRVQLYHVEPPIWCNARAVYISRGPLDVALLQLESVPPYLPPIIPEYTRPSLGVKAYVIGHGLFGPSSGLRPSVSSGVVSKVVEMPKPVCMHELGLMEAEGPLAVVLVTTASVHPGASGGAIVNSDGHMIGLVTSNAKHGSGMFIPHLNFSIPSAALKPIFKYSDTGDKTILSAIDKPDESLSSLWALKSLQPHFQQPQQLPNGWNFPLESKDGKGSRFASFLAERQGGETVTKLNNGSVISKKNLPSKL